jgi:hypothetical protein
VVERCRSHPEVEVAYSLAEEVELHFNRAEAEHHCCRPEPVYNLRPAGHCVPAAAAASHSQSLVVGRPSTYKRYRRGRSAAVLQDDMESTNIRFARRRFGGNTCPVTKRVMAVEALPRQ